MEIVIWEMHALIEPAFQWKVLLAYHLFKLIKEMPFQTQNNLWILLLIMLIKIMIA